MHLFSSRRTGTRYNSLKDMMNQADQYNMSRLVTVMLKRRSTLQEHVNAPVQKLNPELPEYPGD
jgi:hypothetical protein